MIVDSHHHFWSLGNPFTDWPTPDLAPIHRDFLPSDLEAEIAAAGVTGTVLVQAAPALAETHWLLEIAARTPTVLGVVGWVDLAAPSATEDLTALAHDPLLRGLRPMLQSIPQQGWILAGAVEPALRAMAGRGLCFDALVRADQIGEITRLARRHPDLRIVLDHGGKPDIANGVFAPWAADLEVLAACPNVWCKLSGLWTEAGQDLSDATIAPWARHILSCFGTARTIWGSDWPVVRLAGGYTGWLAQCRRLFDDLDDHGRAQVFALNGMDFYGLARS